MRASFTVHGAVAASHQVDGHPVCGRLHGHHWTIAVTVEPMRAEPVYAIGEALRALCAELDHRDLNVMLPGVIPSPEGVASWVRERLLLAFPLITTVEVSNGDYSARLEWPLR